MRPPLPLLWAGLLLSFAPTALQAEDLILVGEDLTLDGAHSFEVVTLSAGATLRTRSKAEGGTGALFLSADTLTVESGSFIVADGAGYLGTEQGRTQSSGPGESGLSGGGGGHGGLGGAGSPVEGALGGEGGERYGPEASPFGSPGGAGDGEEAAGAGGGALTLRAGEIVIAGTVSAQGDHGEGLSGGGSGGTIHIIGADITLRGTLSVAGGDGGVSPGLGGGGGGGGGNLKIEIEEGDFALATLDREGGEGSLGAQDGSEGGVSVTITDFDGDGYNALEGDCEPTDPEVGPGAVEILDGEDSDCDGRIDEGTDVYDDDGDGVSENSGDCDDDNPSVSPGALEIPDGQDNDCDGAIDEAATTPGPGESPTPDGTPSPTDIPETYPIDDGALVDIIDDPRGGCRCDQGPGDKRGGEALGWLFLLMLLYPGSQPTPASKGPKSSMRVV